MKKLMFLSLASLLASTSWAQATLVKKVEASNVMDISYSHYKLANGLSILVHEDHSDPLVHLNVTYHVGSAREVPGKSGFAHFFEHMLFQGSKHVADEEHFKLITQYGGNVNGNTTRDRTVYIETFPSNFTETALWMEADRMGFFLEGFTQKKFENQRATVKNEKDQSYDVPYGFSQEVITQQLYPAEHPYSWTTIGYVDDLDRADSNDLKNFFLRWYGPNNACIILSGDVKTEEVVNWVQKYFGGIPAGPAVNKQRVKPVTLAEDKAITLTDINAYVPVIFKTYIGVPVLHQDEAALDMMATIMGSGRNSHLYKTLVDSEKALQANVSNNPMGVINHELAGYLYFIAAGYPNLPVLDLQSDLDKAIATFSADKFSDEDLENAKTVLKDAFKSGLETASFKANQLSEMWYLSNGEMNTTRSALWEQYKNVTKDDIMRVFNKYIKNAHSSTVIIEPLPYDLAEKAKDYKYKSFNPNVNYKNPVAEAEYIGLKPRIVKDDFDRTKRPQPTAPKSPILPIIYKDQMANGLKVIGTKSTETDEISILISLKGGALLEGSDFNPGTVQQMTSSMNEGTANITSAELEARLDKIASSVSFSSSNNAITINLSTSKEYLDQAIAILEETMFKPRWDKEQFRKDQKQFIQNAKSGLRSRNVGARNAWNKIMYGDNLYGNYITASDMAKVSIDDCKRFYDKYFAPDNGVIIIGGNVDKTEILNKLSFLNKWQPKGITVPTPTIADNIQTSQIFGVDYANANQSDLLIGFKSLPYDYNGEFYKSQLMNFTLGSNFNSRLNLDIREDKGWTYGIRSGFGAGIDPSLPGFYTVSAGINASATDSAISQILYILQNFKDNGLTQEEFEFTKKALLASEGLRYETLGQKISLLYQIALRDLPLDYMSTQTEILQKITKAELDALAKKNLDLSKLVIVVAGDMFILKDKLDALGLGKVQVLQSDGSGKVKYNKPKGEIKHTKNY